MIHGIPFAVVDAVTLDDRRRALLQPDEVVADATAANTRLPRFFYEVPSWDAALRTRLTRHFTISEFMDVDLHEAAELRMFPRYVPCAVALLAAHMEVLRLEVGLPVHVSANGGYRSPAHARSRPSSTHAWGTAANIYRIGDEYLDNRSAIRRYSLLAAALLPGVYVKPDDDGRQGTALSRSGRHEGTALSRSGRHEGTALSRSGRHGWTDDHVHLDLGYVTAVPREAVAECA